MGKIPSSINPKSLTPQERQELSSPEQHSFIERMDKEVFNKAVQGYVKDPKKNIPNLIEYAKVLRVQTRVKELIGVWL